MRLPWRPDGRIVTGLVMGLALAVLGPLAINRTTVADRIVAPLMVDDRPGPADAIVVLGAGVIGDCGANRYAVRRVLRALDLWRRQLAPYLVFTGGHSGPCAAADAMARLAVDLGVPAARIRLERASTSTHENAGFTAPLLRGWGASRILLVSDRLHMRRAVAAFAREGLDVRPVSVPVFEGHDDNVEMLRWGLREFAALAYYRARGWLDPATSTVAAVRPEFSMSTPDSSSGPLVVLGASYAAGWALPAIGGVAVVNRGVGGEKTADLAARFERDVVAARPRAVLLWGFINDITGASGTDMDATLHGVRERYTALVAAARQQGIEPILATEITLGPMQGVLMEAVAGLVGALRGRQSYQDRINGHVMATNRWLLEFAARERVTVLDLQSVLAAGGTGRARAFTQADGSHITAAGYDALTSYASPILQEFLRAR